MALRMKKNGKKKDSGRSLPMGQFFLTCTDCGKGDINGRNQSRRNQATGSHTYE